MNSEPKPPDALTICRFWLMVYLGIAMGGSLFGGLVSYGFPIGWIAGAILAGVVSVPVVGFVGGVAAAVRAPRSRIAGAVAGAATGLTSLSLLFPDNLATAVLVCLCGGGGGGFAACLARDDGFRFSRITVKDLLVVTTWFVLVAVAWRLTMAQG